jgi:redox-sensing transcriptional repressor
VEVPEVVVGRLPQYVRVLRDLQKKGNRVVSSKELGDLLQMTPAQIRKDLSYFGRFGKQGRGYNVGDLLDQLKGILGLDREWRIALIGVGRLGRAILGYPGFAPEGFQIVAAFDDDQRQVGQALAGLIVQPMSEMLRIVAEKDIRIAIVAVPAAQAQNVVNQLVACGVKSVLNYAPVSVQTPNGVRVRGIDPVLALQSMTYYLGADSSNAERKRTHRTGARA